MLDTFSNLRQAVRDWANHRHVTETKAEEFIRAAERRAGRILRITELEVTTADYNGAATPKDFLVDATAPYFTLPADFLELKAIWCYVATENDAPPPTYEYGRVTTQPLRISWERMTEQLSGYETATMPVYYARQGSQVWLYPVNSRHFVRINYWAQPPFLSSTQASNALLATSPELLLYAACSEAAMFIKKPDEAAQFDARFASEVEVLQRRTDRAELGGGSLVQRSPMYG